MAAFSGAASLALLSLALLGQPCLAAADADCRAEEQDESALLQSQAADRHQLVANSSKKCGIIYIDSSWTCCLDKNGNGIGAAPGSICCESKQTGGVLACGAGSVCNPHSGLCFAPGTQTCGDIGCATGTECWGATNTCYVPLPNTVKCGADTMIQCAAGGICCANGTAPLCGGAGSTCCYKDNIASLCAPGMSCNSEGICVAR